MLPFAARVRAFTGDSRDTRLHVESGSVTRTRPGALSRDVARKQGKLLAFPAGAFADHQPSLFVHESFVFLGWGGMLGKAGIDGRARTSGKG